MNSRYKTAGDPLSSARQVAQGVARRFASSVDRENRFPAEAVEALRDAGLLALLVPKATEGMGERFSDACEVAMILGEECVSTALIWAMHSQQIAIIADHASSQWHDVLADVAARGALVASATTEPEKGGTCCGHMQRCILREATYVLHAHLPS